MKRQNSESPILLYEKIKAGIKEYIKNHNLKSGDKIPNESELCEEYDVSRITIRRAIKELVEEGFLEVIRGKGTFVKAPKKDLHLLNLKGFTEGLSKEENNMKKEIKFKGTVYDNAGLSNIFSNKETDFLRLVRVVKNSDGPFSVDYAYFPLSLYPGIEELITDDVSTFALIRDHYNIQFLEVEKEIEYVLPSEEVCEYLGISKTTPVIQVKKIIYGSEEVPVHYSKYYLIGDRVKFYINAHYSDKF